VDAAVCTVTSAKKNSNAGKKSAETGAEMLAKFVISEDPLNVVPDNSMEVGTSFAESADLYPLVFGDPVRNFTRHCHEPKAAEWAIVRKHACHGYA
jgi:hypothetical protein